MSGNGAVPAEDDLAPPGGGVGGETKPVQSGEEHGKGLNETVIRLAALPPLEYDLVRFSEARRLKVRLPTLDDEVEAARDEGLKAARASAKPGGYTNSHGSGGLEQQAGDGGGDPASADHPGTAARAAGFSKHDGCLCYRQQEDKPAVLVSAWFTVLAETADAAGESNGLLLRWTDRQKVDHEWTVPRSLLHDTGNKIAAQLDTCGCWCSTGEGAHSALKRYLSIVVAPGRWLTVNRAGWHPFGDGFVYIMPSGDAFGPGSDAVALETHRLVSAGATKRNGTLNEWQREIGRYAVGNHRLAMMTSAALAPALLDITGHSSGGVHVAGDSSIGKTVMLRSPVPYGGEERQRTATCGPGTGPPTASKALPVRCAMRCCRSMRSQKLPPKRFRT